MKLTCLIVLISLLSISCGKEKEASLIWQFKLPNTDSCNGLAIGHFNGDYIPDVFTFVNKGQFPCNTASFQIMLNGFNGKLEYIDSNGCAGFS